MTKHLLTVASVLKYGNVISSMSVCDVLLTAYNILGMTAAVGKIIFSCPSVPFPIIAIHMLYCGASMFMRRRHKCKKHDTTNK